MKICFIIIGFMLDKISLSIYSFLLGGCPRIGIFSQIEVLQKNKHSHILDIASIIFL